MAVPVVVVVVVVVVVAWCTTRPPSSRLAKDAPWLLLHKPPLVIQVPTGVVSRRSSTNLCRSRSRWLMNHQRRRHHQPAKNKKSKNSHIPTPVVAPALAASVLPVSQAPHALHRRLLFLRLLQLEMLVKEDERPSRRNGRPATSKSTKRLAVSAGRRTYRYTHRVVSATEFACVRACVRACGPACGDLSTILAAVCDCARWEVSVGCVKLRLVSRFALRAGTQSTMHRSWSVHLTL